MNQSDAEASWRRLLTLMDGRVRAYVRTLHCSQDEVDELAWDIWQEAVMADVASIPGDPWPPLRNIARKLCAARMRQWRHEDSCNGEGMSDGRCVEDVNRDESVDVMDWVNGLLSTLPEQQRMAVDFRCRWGWPYWAVAAALGVAEPTARVHVARGLKRLRDLARKSVVDQPYQPSTVSSRAT